MGYTENVMKNKVIVIDTDRRTERLLKGLLSNEYELFTARGISEGYSLVTANNPDIVIIDPLFPKKEGIAFISSLKEWSDCYIIALSENSTELAAVSVLDAGADDYIRKPFFSSELGLRVRKCIETTEKIETARGINALSRYKNGGLLIEFDVRRVSINGEAVHLTGNEYKILALLCRFSGKVLTYDYIMKSVWGPKSDNGTGILRVNIANIRRKIEKNPVNPVYLMTENGVGYRIAENEEVRAED